MYQPLERKGSSKRGVNEQKSQPEEAGFSSVFHSGKYSLIQDQLQELTHLQQKIRIGRAVSSLLIQHVMNTVKTFQELFSGNKFDHYVQEHFCEQLAKASQLAENLVSKFSMDDRISKKNQREHMLRNLRILREMHKMDIVTEVIETRQDAQPLTWPQICSSSHAQSAAHCFLNSTSSLLDEQEMRPAVDMANVSAATAADSASLPSNHSEAMSAQPFYPWSGTTQLSWTPDPGHRGSSGPWEEMSPQRRNASENLSSSSSYLPNSKPSGIDLLEKNLAETQNLRQRLEASVFISDRLQERLEYVLSNANQGRGKKGTKTSWFCLHLGSLKRAYGFAIIEHTGVHYYTPPHTQPGEGTRTGTIILTL
uniref:Uncharacterized protein n=1 Tax=Catagonus wagneri TaxID=51154 RepID=A0A8C3YGU6_9CETA